MGALPALALFVWGTLGGAAMAAAVFAVPALTQLAFGVRPVEGRRFRVVAISGIVVLLGVIAGIVALTLPDTATRRQAILTGLASQAILKGLTSAGREALAPVLRA